MGGFMIPNMSDVLEDFSQPITVKEITTTTVDFKEVETVVELNIEAVVQVADIDKLKVDNIDYSKEYIMVHSVYPVEINNVIDWLGTDYVVVRKKNYSQYGYTEVVGEEVR